MARVAPTDRRAARLSPGARAEPAASTRVSRAGATAARPAGSTLQGSQRRSATESTAGSASSTSCVPSSCSSSRRQTGPRSCSRRTPLAKGRSSSSASSGPTCPVSPSMELRPRRTRSKGPAARSAAARARAVARVSEPAKAGVAGVQPGVGAPGHRLAQDVLGARWAERHHGAGAAGVPGERDPLGHRPAAVRVHLDAHATPARTSRPPSSRSDSASGTCLARDAIRQRVTRRPAHLRHRPSGSAGGAAGVRRPHQEAGARAHRARSE